MSPHFPPSLLPTLLLLVLLPFAFTTTAPVAANRAPALSRKPLRHNPSSATAFIKPVSRRHVVPSCPSHCRITFCPEALSDDHLLLTLPHAPVTPPLCLRRKAHRRPHSVLALSASTAYYLAATTAATVSAAPTRAFSPAKRVNVTELTAGPHAPRREYFPTTVPADVVRTVVVDPPFEHRISSLAHGVLDYNQTRLLHNLCLHLPIPDYRIRRPPRRTPYPSASPSTRPNPFLPPGATRSAVAAQADSKALHADVLATPRPDRARKRDCVTFRAATPYLEVRLTWGAADDLDVEAVEPDGNLLYYLQRRSRHGGLFVVDDHNNAACEENAASGAEGIAYRSRGDMMAGDYVFRVARFMRCSRGRVAFRLAVLKEGREWFVLHGGVTEEMGDSVVYDSLIRISVPAGGGEPSYLTGEAARD